VNLYVSKDISGEIVFPQDIHENCGKQYYAKWLIDKNNFVKELEIRMIETTSFFKDVNAKKARAEEEKQRKLQEQMKKAVKPNI